MPSNFQGKWQYAKHEALGAGVVKNMGLITVTDEDDNPATVTVIGPNGWSLNLPVENPKTPNDISFRKDVEDMTCYRGRLVILSANTPAMLIGSISMGTQDPYGPVGDANIDVFIAVKVG